MKLILTFLFITLLMVSQLFGNKDTYLLIIPAPKVVNNFDSYYDLPDKLKIILYLEKKEKLNYGIEILKQSLKKYLNVDSKITYSNDNEGDINIRIVDNLPLPVDLSKDLRDEAYRLAVTEDGIVIDALSLKGNFYGMMSLIQILEKMENRQLPLVEILDWPDLEVRGISDDISRGQVSKIENFRRIIGFLARYKMNTYMPYMEDILTLESYPSIGEGRGALIKKEIDEIVRFADENFVEVVPIFQTLGHYENILSQKEFVKYAEFPGAASLNVSSEDFWKICSKKYLHFSLRNTSIWELMKAGTLDLVKAGIWLNNPTLPKCTLNIIEECMRSVRSIIKKS